MITPEALSALRDRLAAATAGRPGLDAAVWYALFDGARGGLSEAEFMRQANNIDPYTSSIDAALGLVTRLLPGWMWVREHSDGHAYVRLLGPEYARYEFMGARNSHCTGSFNADRNVPIAILIALVSALSQPGVQS